MKLIDKVSQQYDIISKDSIKNFWCPKEIGYDDFVKCKEEKYDCHSHSCWEVEIKEL